VGASVSFRGVGIVGDMSGATEGRKSIGFAEELEEDPGSRSFDTFPGFIP
jgi:hypothetical protein